jgi:hypothetical protein
VSQLLSRNGRHNKALMYFPAQIAQTYSRRVSKDRLSDRLNAWTSLSVTMHMRSAFLNTITQAEQKIAVSCNPGGIAPWVAQASGTIHNSRCGIPHLLAPT